MDILTLAVAKNSASSTPGQKGDTGNGIKSTVMNDDYTLTIEFTDGTSYTTPSIRGEKGETGSKGAKGDKGDKGDSGTNGTDWNQNNPIAPDYVKNRLAWTDDPVETVLFDGTVVNDDSIDIELIVGQEYVVTLDGVEYVLTAQGIDDMVFIGSESLWLDTDYIDTEPPFAFGIDDGGSWFYTINGEYEDEHSLKIVANIAEVHKLDRKYLPDSIAVLRAEINSSEDYLRLYMNDELLGDVPRDESVSLKPSVFHQICDMVGDGKLIGFLREKNSTSELTYNAILTCSKHNHIIHMNVFSENGGTKYIKIAMESSY